MSPGVSRRTGTREAIRTRTLGQPWLVNALAYETCFERKAGWDRSHAITADDVAEAREALLVRRVTHLDQLADKLREDRVRRVVEPMLSGPAKAINRPPDRGKSSPPNGSKQVRTMPGWLKRGTSSATIRRISSTWSAACRRSPPRLNRHCSMDCRQPTERYSPTVSGRRCTSVGLSGTCRPHRNSLAADGVTSSAASN